MKKIMASLVVVGVLLSGSAGACDHVNKECPWVLLGLDDFNGIMAWRDTAADADPAAVIGEEKNILPMYETKAACEADKRREIEKYAGRSHAHGDFALYLCTDYRTWK